MHRSEITIDLGALRRNVRALLAQLDGAQVWAVVKADGYGHGATDVAGAALGAGATALCVATVAEALELRREFTTARIVVMGPATNREVAQAREANIELVIGEGDVPLGVRAHLKLDTGMGRYGVAGLSEVPPEVVGLMSHLATADVDATFAEQQIARFAEATRELTHLDRHIANSAAALRYPSSRFDAARCGIALYGLSPFGTDPAEDGLEPVLHWQSHLAQVKQLGPGESTGYGRRFVAEQPTWIGIVPVGYADGFRRDLTGTQVRVAGELRPVVGTVSMDAFAVELDRELPIGTPVVLVGHGVLLDDHARHAGTIGYELASRIERAKPGTQNRGGRLMETLDLVEELQQARAAELSERVRAFVQPPGDERALDVGSGLGALALAPRTACSRGRRGRAATGARRARPQGGRRGRQRRARRRGRAGAALRARVLRPQRHAPHAAPVPRPELVVAELARVTRPGGDRSRRRPAGSPGIRSPPSTSIGSNGRAIPRTRVCSPTSTCAASSTPIVSS